MRETYPNLEALAKTEEAKIGWTDETAAKPETRVRRNFASKGKSPVVRQPAQRFHSSFIHLIKDRKRKIFLIVDNLRVYYAKRLKNGFRKTSNGSRCMILPPTVRN